MCLISLHMPVINAFHLQSIADEVRLFLDFACQVHASNAYRYQVHHMTMRVWYRDWMARLRWRSPRLLKSSSCFRSQKLPPLKELVRILSGASPNWLSMAAAWKRREAEVACCVTSIAKICSKGQGFHKGKCRFQLLTWQTRGQQ